MRMKESSAMTVSSVYLGALPSGEVREAGKPAEQQQMLVGTQTRQLLERLSVEFSGRPQQGAVFHFFTE
jgi:hypothetical protein